MLFAVNKLCQQPITLRQTVKKLTTDFPERSQEAQICPANGRKERQHIHDALGEVKDSIGEWHGWEELSAISRDVIQHRNCKLSNEIRSTARRRFDHAMSVANQLRRQFPSGIYQEPKRTSTQAASQAAHAAIASAVELAA